MLEIAGEKCQICKYGKSYRALGFHHVNPADKLITMSFGGHGIIKILDEITKCILVCNNCHGEIHDGLLEISQIPKIQLTPEKRNEILLRFHKNKKERTNVCICGRHKRKYSKTCKKCVQKARKVERPPKEELERLVWRKPTNLLAKAFGISDSAISKWCKRYGIKKPGVGYWQKSTSNQIRTDIFR